MRIKVMKNVTEKTKIRHRNEINKTLAQLPLAAKRVLCLALVYVDPKKEMRMGQTFKIRADMYAKIAGIHPSVAYKQVKEGAELLNVSKLSLTGNDMKELAKELGLPNSKNIDRLDLSITDYCAYNQNEGFVILRFGYTITPYISRLIGAENKFTTQLIASSLKLRGEYSWSLYQLIRKNYSTFKGKNSFSLSLEELKDELIAYNIDDNGDIIYKYPEYPIFKREVINKAIKEIKEKTEVTFLSCVVDEKEGRKVSKLRFEYAIDEDKFAESGSDFPIELFDDDDSVFLEEFDRKVPPKKK
ncbi:hypothetical protein SK68_05222 [Serratia marcescens]|nr:replication initiation protein [Serratia marcescens]KLX10535.1 hypothetical protein SK68_05222 [Serratia marcescens]KMJ02723.1 hypothetical protein SN03_05198 [Serratia marcescens]